VPGGGSSLDRDQKLDSEIETPKMTSEPDLMRDHYHDSGAEDSSPASAVSTPTGLEKSGSLSRKAHVGGSGRFPRKGANLVRAAAKRDSLSMGGSFEEEGRPTGVSLTDPAMDD
jgi:hypothetical protein